MRRGRKENNSSGSLSKTFFLFSLFLFLADSDLVLQPLLLQLLPLPALVHRWLSLSAPLPLKRLTPLCLPLGVSARALYSQSRLLPIRLPCGGPGRIGGGATPDATHGDGDDERELFLPCDARFANMCAYSAAAKGSDRATSVIANTFCGSSGGGKHAFSI